jgi:hypothetical protein
MAIIEEDQEGRILSVSFEGEQEIIELIKLMRKGERRKKGKS